RRGRWRRQANRCRGRDRRDSIPVACPARRPPSRQGQGRDGTWHRSWHLRITRWTPRRGPDPLLPSTAPCSTHRDPTRMHGSSRTSLSARSRFWSSMRRNGTARHLPPARREAWVMSATILIADDDPVQRRLLEAMVRRFGYEVTTADGGEAALGELERGSFDL